jgi:hypothetical protein
MNLGIYLLCILRYKSVTYICDVYSFVYSYLYEFMLTISQRKIAYIYFYV